MKLVISFELCVSYPFFPDRAGERKVCVSMSRGGWTESMCDSLVSESMQEFLYKVFFSKIIRVHDI